MSFTEYTSEALDTTLGLVPETMVVIDQQGKIVRFNAHAEAMFGYIPSQMIGRSFCCLMLENYRSGHTKNLQQYFASPTPRSMGDRAAIPAQHASGYQFPVKITLTPINLLGRPHVLAVIHDVSHLMRVAEKYNGLYKQYQAITNSVPEILYKIDCDARITWWNQHVEEVTGFQAEQLQGQNVLELFVVDDRDKVSIALQEGFKNGRKEVRALLQTVAGPKCYDFKSIVTQDKAGNVTGMTSIGRDVSRQVAIEKISRESQSRSARQQYALLEISRLHSLNKGNPKQIWEFTTEKVSKVLNVARASIWLYSEDRQKLVCEDLFEADKNMHAACGDLQAKNYTGYFPALMDSRTISADSERTGPHSSEFTYTSLKPVGTTSMLDAAIRVGEQDVGVLCLEHIGKERQWTLDEQKFAGSVADLLSLAMEVQRHYEAKESLKRSQQMLMLHMQQTSVGMIEWDKNFCVMEWNNAAEQIFGYTKKEALGRHANDLIVPESARSHVNAIWQELLKDAGGVGSANENVTKHEDIITCDWYNTTLTDANGVVIGVASLVQDITAKKEAEDKLSQLIEHNDLLLSSTADAIIGVDQELNCTFANDAASTMLGFDKERLLDKNILPFLRGDDENLDLASSVNDVVDAIEHGNGYWSEDVILFGKDRKPFPAQLSCNAIFKKGKLAGSVVVFRNITQLRELSRHKDYLERYDPLTGLLNRYEFEQRLTNILSDAQQYEKENTLCYMDFDQFRVLNDTCGHTAGDEFLRQVSQLIKQQIRRDDVLARFGGDEFALLLVDCPLKKAVQVAETIRKCIDDFRFQWKENHYAVSVSIGLIPLIDSIQDTSEALMTADAACEVAKDHGRNRVHVYVENDEAVSRRHGQMHWVSRLRQALELDQFALYVQPIVSTRAPSRIEHYEVLLRLIDEEGRVIPPGEFIPAAERYVQMMAIDRWVVEKSLAWMRQYKSQVGLNIKLAINLSAQSLEHDINLDFISQQFTEHQVDPADVCFEVTETAAVANFAHTIKLIKRLHSLGCHIALDDFGSGMSSFAYLKNMPVDYLKIDGHFIKEIASDMIDHAMVASINQVGHVMGIETIAEFVEDDRILAQLKKIGVDYAQGYGIARPFPIEDLLISNGTAKGSK